MKTRSYELDFSEVEAALSRPLNPFDNEQFRDDFQLREGLKLGTSASLKEARAQRKYRKLLDERLCGYSPSLKQGGRQ